MVTIQHRVNSFSKYSLSIHDLSDIMPSTGMMWQTCETPPELREFTDHPRTTNECTERHRVQLDGTGAGRRVGLRGGQRSIN